MPETKQLSKLSSRSKKFGFNKIGERINPQSPNSVAMMIIGDQNRYFVKIGTVGYNHGSIFNPLDSEYQENAESRVDRSTSRPVYEYKEVNEKCFSFYKKFLESRNIYWFRQAERIIDD